MAMDEFRKSSAELSEVANGHPNGELSLRGKDCKCRQKIQTAKVTKSIGADRQKKGLKSASTKVTRICASFVQASFSLPASSFPLASKIGISKFPPSAVCKKKIVCHTDLLEKRKEKSILRNKLI